MKTMKGVVSEAGAYLEKIKEEPLNTITLTHIIYVLVYVVLVLTCCMIV
jgi:hypothetical protein